MALIVQKFGGSSVANAERVRNVASRVVETMQAGNQVAVSYTHLDVYKRQASDYVKYDLNRDGKVDSKDVAMVLVSWNE